MPPALAGLVDLVGAEGVAHQPDQAEHDRAAAGSTEKPSVIAVSAESGWATSPSVLDR